MQLTGRHPFEFTNFYNNRNERVPVEIIRVERDITPFVFNAPNESRNCTGFHPTKYC